MVEDHKLEFERFELNQCELACGDFALAIDAEITFFASRVFFRVVRQLDWQAP